MISKPFLNTPLNKQGTTASPLMLINSLEEKMRRSDTNMNKSLVILLVVHFYYNAHWIPNPTQDEYFDKKRYTYQFNTQGKNQVMMMIMVKKAKHVEESQYSPPWNFSLFHYL